MDDSLQKQVCEIQATVNGAEADREERVSDQLAAASAVARLKESVLEKKAALQNASKAIETACEAIHDGKRSQKLQAVQLKTATKNVERLEATKTNVFGPLKEMQAKGVK